MTTEEIVHLATLARITITDEEAAKLHGEIDDIISYVSTLDSVVQDPDAKKSVGPVHNVFREDVVTNEPDQYTEALLAAMPERVDRFMKVKKILNPDND